MSAEIKETVTLNQVLVGWGLGIAIAVLAMAAERPLADAASRLG